MASNVILIQWLNDRFQGILLCKYYSVCEILNFLTVFTIKHLAWPSRILRGTP